MAIRQRRMQRRVRENAPMVGGGAVGLGATVGLRQFLDVENGQEVSIFGEPGSVLSRLTRPSAAYGLGAGGLSGLFWFMDVGPRWINDFWLGHAVTAIPAGAASAAVPRQVDSGGTASRTSQQRPLRDAGGSHSGNGTGEFSASGGRSADTTPAN